jgi:hypothetical protein
MALTNEELSVLSRSLRNPANPPIRKGPHVPAGPAVPRIDTTYRPAAVGNVHVPGHRRTTGGRTARAVTAALLLAACTGAAAIAWQSAVALQSDDGAVERMIAQWAPQRVLASLLRPGQPASAVQPTAPTVEATAANPAPLQSGSPARTPPEGVAPAAVASSVEPASSPGSIDIAIARQEIEELKASIEELKAGQRQMSLDIAKASEARFSDARSSDVTSSEVGASEQNLPPKISAHPLRATAPRARKPMPLLPPVQATANPSVPRPPMPVP